MAIRTGLRLALGTLTVLPVGPVSVDRPTARAAMLLAPLAALPLGLLAGLVLWSGHAAGLPGFAVGLLVVGALALASRGLHLDGLADTADGLGSGRPAAGALEVMRRGDVGPFGVVTLVLVLGLQASTLGSLAGLREAPWLVALLVVLSRVALPLACRVGVPAARSDGLGAAVAGVVPRWAAVASGVLAALLLGLALTLVRPPAGPPGVLTALLGLGAGAVLVRRCVRRLGGVTGDVLGAAVEVTLTVLLLGTPVALNVG